MFWIFFLLLFVALFGFILIIVFFCLNIVLSSKKNEKNKMTSFESGFLSMGKIQKTFSIHFFVIMLMFVIFDVEVIMLMGLVLSDFNSLFIFMVVFLFILGGLYMEWFFNKLVWVF